MANPSGLPAGARVDDGPNRRVFPRRPAFGEVAGQRLGRSAESRRSPSLSLSLRDLSVGGVSGWSQTQLSHGEPIRLIFPPDGLARGFDVRGRVMRCEASSMGYRIAISFDHTLDRALRKAA